MIGIYDTMTALEIKYDLLKLIIEIDDNEIIKQIEDYLIDVILDSIPPGPEISIEIIEKALDDSAEREFISLEDLQKRYGINPNKKKPSALEIKQDLLKQIVEIEDRNIIRKVYDFSQKIKINNRSKPPVKSVEEINQLIEIADNEAGTSLEEFRKYYDL